MRVGLCVAAAGLLLSGCASSGPTGKEALAGGLAEKKEVAQKKRRLKKRGGSHQRQLRDSLGAECVPLRVRSIRQLLSAVRIRTHYIGGPGKRGGCRELPAQARSGGAGISTASSTGGKLSEVCRALDDSRNHGEISSSYHLRQNHSYVLWNTIYRYVFAGIAMRK
jgi:hypothetical protein